VTPEDRFRLGAANADLAVSALRGEMQRTSPEQAQALAAAHRRLQTAQNEIADLVGRWLRRDRRQAS